SFCGLLFWRFGNSFHYFNTDTDNNCTGDSRGRFSLDTGLCKRYDRCNTSNSKFITGYGRKSLEPTKQWIAKKVITCRTRTDMPATKQRSKETTRAEYVSQPYTVRTQTKKPPTNKPYT